MTYHMIRHQSPMGNLDTRGAPIYVRSSTLKAMVDMYDLEGLFSARVSAPSTGQIVSIANYLEPQMARTKLEVNKSLVNSQEER